MHKGQQDAVLIIGGSASWGGRVGELTLACIFLWSLRASTLLWIGLSP